MTKTTANAAKKQRGKPFKPGQSGNPSGKKPGTRNKTTLALEALLEGEAEAITRKAIEEAKKGDMTAIKLVLERLLPPRKDRPVTFTLPPLKNAGDLPKAIQAIIDAVAVGDLTPLEAQSVSQLFELQRKAIETSEIERKLEGLQLLLNGRK